MDKELEVLEKIQRYCKGQPWCGLCKYSDMGCGCTLGRPVDWNLSLLKRARAMMKNGMREHRG